MATTFTVEADFDNDGTFSADLTQYVESTTISRGFSNERARVADTGRVTFILRNDDKRFSPLNSAGPYYGTLLPYRQIRIRAHSGASSWTRFRGYIRGFDPAAGIYGTQTVRVWAEDAFSVLQRDTVAMPLQENKTADDLITKICAQIFGGDSSTAILYFYGEPNNNEELTIGKTTYTFKTTLTPTANEVIIDGGRYFAPGINDAPLNLAAAIVLAEGSGTYYAESTARQPNVTAQGYPAIGVNDADLNTYYDLQNSATNYEALGGTFAFGGVLLGTNYRSEITEMPVQRLYLWLKKTGNPTGTLTINIETADGASGPPSDSLYDANLTTTLDEADLTTSGAWYAVDFPARVILPEYPTAESQQYWVTITTDRAASGTDYISWGVDTSPSTVRFFMSQKTGGTWSARATEAMGLWVPGMVDLTANVPGAWGNTILLDSAPYHANADTLTLTTGAIISGTLSDTYEENGVFLVLSEVTGTPGFDYVFEFPVTGVGLVFDGVIDYTGSGGHTVEIQAYNNIGATYDTLGEITPGPQNYIFDLDPDHTSGGGVVKIRLYHSSPGNTSHQLNIDHLFVEHSLPSADTKLQPSVAHLTGGTDAPAGLLDIQTGRQVFDIAADLWTDEETTGKDAGSDVTYSEYGLWWIAGDGVITFRNRDYEFGLPQVTPALTVSGEHDRQQGILSDDRVRNHIIINFAPRAEQATGTVARANRVIKVDGTSGTQRWNKNQGYIGSSNSDAPQPGDTVIRLPFRDIDGGQATGAKNVITPVPGTDYSVNDAADGTGFNYTLTGRITTSMVIQGSAVELSIKNDATGPLYISDLVVRGTLLVSWDMQQEIFEDTDSITAYGQRVWRYDVPLPSDTPFIESLASYLCGRFKNPAYIVDAITFEGQTVIGGVNLMSLEIGDVVSLTEDQTAVNGALYYIRGFDEMITGDGQDTAITLRLKPISNQTYWILDNATYGVLDSTTRLAL